jgi:ABC-type polysaccharide/polyol phosphate transport system ATPase subunit
MTQLIVKNLFKKLKISNRERIGLLASIIGLGKKNDRGFSIIIDDISLSVSSGEFLAIIGKNASGKSTLLRTLAGIYCKDSGIINNHGKIVSLIELEVGFKLRLTMADNIYLCGALFGLTRKEIKKKFNDIVEFSELDKFVNTKLYKFSQGMEERLSFSIAVNCNPEILLLDELFNVADEKFKNKAIGKLNVMAKNGVMVK